MASPVAASAHCSRGPSSVDFPFSPEPLSTSSALPRALPGWPEVPGSRRLPGDAGQLPRCCRKAITAAYRYVPWSGPTAGPAQMMQRRSWRTPAL